MARELKLTRTTAGHAIKVLLDSELVWEPTGLTEVARVGRPSVGVSLNPNGAFFVGLDVSSTSLTAVLIDFSKAIRAKFVVPIGPDFHDIVAVTEQLAQLAKRAMRAAGKFQDRVHGIGVSLPGLVARDGRVAVMPLLGWRDVDMRALFAGHLGEDLNIRLCNDAVALARVVSANAGEADKRDTLLILMSEGIGSAMVRQGRVVEGFNGFAGELGLMVMAPRLGQGSTQTFQDLAGSRPFLPFIKPGVPIADAILNLASQKTPSTEFGLVLERWAESLAAGFLNASRMLDPEHIVLGGPLAPLYPRVAVRVESLIRSELGDLPAAPITVAQYGAEGSAIGAAAMLRESFFELPGIGKSETID